MNRSENLERELTAWFIDTATPRVPDFTDDILRLTAGTRQRPRWSFPERWLPMSVITLAGRSIRPVPWRAVGLIALLALLLAAGVALYAGSQPRPAPMLGLASNGLVAYETDGDIFTVDPANGTRRALIAGPARDHTPRFSLDGTRLLFLRGDGVSDVPVVADADGRNEFVMETTPLHDVAHDMISWSPDGRSVALLAVVDGTPTLHVVDVVAGTVVPVASDYVDGEVHWRPPDGRSFIFVGGSETAQSPYLYSVDDGSVTPLPQPEVTGQIRPSGWSADGRQVAMYVRTNTPGPDGTYLIDVATGSSTFMPVGYGEPSNDGTRFVGINGDETHTFLCVASADGGLCRQISLPFLGPWGTDYHWSPDDTTILTRRSDGAFFVFDPDGEPTQAQPAWIADGGESWQRRAP